MLKHIITAGLLIAALLLYSVGLALPATGFLILGVLAEGGFWWRVLRGGRE